MRSTSAIVSFAWITLATANTYGDPTPAQRAISEAEALVANQEFAAAAGKYREAYAADPKPELMCNVGVAYYKAKDYPHAFRFLDQCIASGTSLDAAFIDQVRQVVAAVDAKLRAGDFVALDITVEPATASTLVETAGRVEEPLLGSRRTWIPHGHYKLTIHAEGYVDKVIEGDANGHDPTPQRAKLDPRPIIEGTSGRGSGAPSLPPPPPPPPQASKTFAIISTSVAATTGLAALGSFLFAKKRAGDAGDAMDIGVYKTASASARTWQHASWVLGGIGGGAAIAASILWYRAFKAPGHVEVSATGSGAAVSVGGAF